MMADHTSGSSAFYRCADMAVDLKNKLVSLVIALIFLSFHLAKVAAGLDQFDVATAEFCRMAKKSPTKFFEFMCGTRDPKFPL